MLSKLPLVSDTKNGAKEFAEDNGVATILTVAFPAITQSPKIAHAIFYCDCHDLWNYRSTKYHTT